MATRNTETVTNVLQRISDLRGESSTNTDAMRVRAVSEAYTEFAKRRMWLDLLLRDQTISGSGVNAYTIGSSNFPMRKKGLSEVFVGGTTEDKRYSVVDYFKYHNLYNQNNSARLAYEYYDQTNDLWKVYINPAPTASETIYYSYFYTSPKLTLVTDTVICPNMEYIVKMAMSYISENEDELERALDLKNEAEQLLSEMEALETMPAQNQLKAMSAMASQVRDRGLGGY